MTKDWIVILNYNLADLCIARLRELAPHPGFGLFFVDNASAPQDRQALTEAVRAAGGAVIDAQSDFLPAVGQALAAGARCVLLRSGANLGYAAGNNLALRALYATCGQRLRCVVLNPDVEVAGEDLLALLEHPSEICGPAIHERYLDGLRPFEDDCDFSTGFANEDGRAPAREIGVRLCGCCMKFSGGALERYGYLPEECFLYDEETFFFSRVWHKGGRPAYLPNLVVRHAGSAAEGKKSFNYFYYIFRNRLLFFRREAAPRGASRWRFARLYFGWWRPVLLRQLKNRNLAGAKGVAMGLLDGLRGRSGRYGG